MRCRDAKHWLTAQRESDLLQPEVVTFQEHLKRCARCHTYKQRQERLDTMLGRTAPRTYVSISTDRIMGAVQRQKQITQQLEFIRALQQTRVAHLPKLAAIAFLSVGMLPVLLLVVFLIQPDLLVNALIVLNAIIDALIGLAQYLQTMLALITHNNLLLSGVALILVVMMGMWLRLMRYPQEA